MGSSLPDDRRAALLVSQEGPCVECVARVATSNSQGRVARDLDGRHAGRCAARIRQFVSPYQATAPTAVEKLEKDRDSLLAFYDFPAEPGQHVRTTNPIESTFATVRHRTTRTHHGVSRPTFLGLAFMLREEAEQSWHRMRGAYKIGLLLSGVTFKDGIQAQDNPPEKLGFTSEAYTKFDFISA